jgi:hypothetical protein
VGLQGEKGEMDAKFGLLSAELQQVLMITYKVPETVLLAGYISVNEKNVPAFKEHIFSWKKTIDKCIWR